MMPHYTSICIYADLERDPIKTAYNSVGLTYR